MGEGPTGAAADLLRILAVVLLVGLMGLLYKVVKPPAAANAPARGFPGAHMAPDAGPPTPVTYDSTLSHLPPEAPRVIEGRRAGIYLKRNAECAAEYVAVEDLCVHREVQSDSRGEASVAAFRRGTVPPSVAVVDGSVRWPPTIQYERLDAPRDSYSVVGDERQGALTSSGRTAPRGRAESADEELRRLQQERRQQTAEEAAVRERRRAAATEEARVSRYEREERWRRMQVNP